MFEGQKTVVSDINRLFEGQETVVSDTNRLFEGQESGASDEKEAFEMLLFELEAKKSTEKTVLKPFRQFGFDLAFARADSIKLAGITSTPAGELIKKLKKAELIEAVRGQGKGKYRFIILKK